MSDLIHKPDQSVTCPDTALAMLKEGNRRFVSGELMPKDYKAALAVTKDAQKPFACIVTCADSRTCPEQFFDQSIGDIFVCRNAGNVADASVVGSLEFAVGVLGAVVVAVVGHTKCGAVYNAYDGTQVPWPSLQGVLDGINANVKGSADKEAGAADNVAAQVAMLKENAVIKDKGALVVPAFYDIATGEVTW